MTTIRDSRPAGLVPVATERASQAGTPAAAERPAALPVGPAPAAGARSVTSAGGLGDGGGLGSLPGQNDAEPVPPIAMARQIAANADAIVAALHGSPPSPSAQATQPAAAVGAAPGAAAMARALAVGQGDYAALGATFEQIRSLLPHLS